MHQQLGTTLIYNVPCDLVGIKVNKLRNSQNKDFFSQIASPSLFKEDDILAS